MVGSVKKKQLFDHILPHVNQPTVVCTDLEKTVFRAFRINVYSMCGDTNLATPISWQRHLRNSLHFVENLPQGPPTSPRLCNFALGKMSAEIAIVCEANNLMYTQYVDDICISGDDNVARAVIGQIHKVATANGQRIKDIKTEIMDQRHRQRSAGAILNQQPRLLKSYGNKIVGQIRVIEQRGLVTSGEKLHIVGEILHLQVFLRRRRPNQNNF